MGHHEEIIKEDNTISNDVKEVLKRWHTDISKLFSNIEENPEVAFNDEFYNQVLNKKAEFENLEPEEQQRRAPHDTLPLNSEISYEEVAAAIDRAKLHKSFLEMGSNAMLSPDTYYQQYC